MERKFFIDWIRVISIGLLIIYHVAIGFQPWGRMIGFITSNEPWMPLWLPMSMLNVWRIPLLFFVSGMGVYFAMQRRTWKELIKERMLRILLPLLFGMFIIVPVHLLIFRLYYDMKFAYTWDAGHLWFLGNIIVYVFILTPLFYWAMRNRDSKFILLLVRTMGHPAGLLIPALLLVAEVSIVKPLPFELYAMTPHGFWIGFLAFLIGFFFVLSGNTFWAMIQRWRWIYFSVGTMMFSNRLFYMGMQTPAYLIAIESFCWVITVLAFGSKHLNTGGKILSYLSEAAYPVYILHMIFLFGGSALLFPFSMPVPLQFIVLVVTTFAGCFVTFELGRRIKLVRPLLGLKNG